MILISTLQLLEGLGIFSPSTKNKETYQESVTAPLSREHDDDAAMQEDDDNDDPGDSLASVFTAIGKVSHGHG
jgi:hypothetical protein